MLTLTPVQSIQATLPHNTPHNNFSSPKNKMSHHHFIYLDDRHAYDYDVTKMQQSIDSGKIAVPDFATDEAFIAWLEA